ncbi:hypothetical protein [uncultured Methanospirillum sp.]|nr:hypothetical protein [uncultured Methanospirillum sp.]
MVPGKLLEDQGNIARLDVKKPGYSGEIVHMSHDEISNDSE